MKKVVLACDLGGTNLRIAAVSINGEILFHFKNKTPRSDNPNDLIEAFVNSANECKKNLKDCEIVTVAVAVPGIINVKEGAVFKSPNLPELDGFKMAEALGKKLNVKAILENDANAAAIGENWLGASKDYDSSVMITLGTGVGGGIIIDGKILRGIDGTAGEIGHINVEPKGECCGCGSFGCVEQYASATAVVRMAKAIAREHSKFEIADNNKLTAKEVYTFAKNKCEIANEVFRKQGYYLGLMLAGLINSLNPEVIVIGGGAAEGWDLFIPHLKTEIKRRSYKEPAERVKIVRAELGDDAGILGVAKLGFDKLL